MRLVIFVQILFMKKSILLISFLCSVTLILAQQGPHLISPNDVYSLKQVQNPTVSPDGKWILYGVSKADSIKDTFSSTLFMVSWDGLETVSLTEQTKNPSSYAWSPDGKYISFMASSVKEAKEDYGNQLFLMDRRGGEPVQLTDIHGEIQSYSWKKDGKQIVFVVKDPNTADTAKSKVRKPYAIDRYHFKQDYEGYLDNRKSHLYLFDLATKKLDTLTRGIHDEMSASFSHDGNAIAYVSNITENPDRNSNTDIFVLDLKNNRSVKQITTNKGGDFSPKFSPNDESIAFFKSISGDAYNAYDQPQLCVANLHTGDIQIISSSLDRPITTFTWAVDNKHIYALVEDDRKQNIYSFDVQAKTNSLVTNAEAVYSGLSANDGGQMVTLYSNPHTPNEIYALDGETPRKVTKVHDEFLSGLKSIYVKGFKSISSDKTIVSGILYLPDSAAKNMPLVLFIHGGPVAQDDYSFDESRQILAGAGFAVAAVNYRGSSGRGFAYTKSIYSDWGNKEVKDIIGAANYLIREGIADSSKLAIAGWSYGGILTDYTIATDKRFKAAVSGAGSAFQFAMYGSDQYVLQYDEELGAPWKNVKKWIDISYPFFKVDQIKTPTLFMASQNDFNVPVIGAEQMYQAFKHAGIPTELVIYPGQNHGLSIPSYLVYRFQRHIDWFRKYLQ